MTTTEYAPDHTVENRPVAVPTTSGVTYTAVDHGMATKREHESAKFEGFEGDVDYAVRLSRATPDRALTDKMTISGARELARQLNASADAAEERLQADQEAAD